MLLNFFQLRLISISAGSPSFVQVVHTSLNYFCCCTCLKSQSLKLITYYIHTYYILLFSIECQIIAFVSFDQIPIPISTFSPTFQSKCRCFGLGHPAYMFKRIPTNISHNGQRSVRNVCKQMSLNLLVKSDKHMRRCLWKTFDQLVTCLCCGWCPLKTTSDSITYFLVLFTVLEWKICK